MKKVTGIGGIFFRSEDPANLRNWYDQHLGLRQSQHGTALFEWRTVEENKRAVTVWSPFKKDTEYFGPSGQSFMINFRVADLRGLLETLRASGVTIAGDMQEYDYGRFAWVVDPEGNKVELWEPIDSPMDDQLQDHTIY